MHRHGWTVQQEAFISPSCRFLCDWQVSRLAHRDASHLYTGRTPFEYRPRVIILTQHFLVFLSNLCSIRKSTFKRAISSSTPFKFTSSDTHCTSFDAKGPITSAADIALITLQSLNKITET